MKKTTLLLLGLMMMTSASAAENEYVPLVREGVVWEYVEYDNSIGVDPSSEKTKLYTLALNGENEKGHMLYRTEYDKQGNASDWFEADRQYGTIANVLMGDVPVRKVIQHTRYECIDLIAADTGLMEANAHLLEGENGNEAVILKRIAFQLIEFFMADFNYFCHLASLQSIIVSLANKVYV